MLSPRVGFSFLFDFAIMRKPNSDLAGLYTKQKQKNTNTILTFKKNEVLTFLTFGEKRKNHLL